MSSSRPTTRVLIVDSTRMGGQLLASALKRDRLVVVDAAATAEQALDVIAASPVDVALVSAVLEGRVDSGYELAARIHERNPRVQIIMLVETPDREAVLSAFRAGARGVFGRDDSPGTLSKCVTRVHAGQIWASSEHLHYLLEALVAPPQLRLVGANGTALLSPREQEVVHWVAEGLTNREIADRLHLSENTVKNYLFRIFDKLGVSKRVELVLYAASHATPTVHATAPNGAENDGDGLQFQWFRETAETIASNPLAVAEMLFSGRGVEADKSASLMWFIIAEELARATSLRAQSAIVAVEQELTAKQRESARAAAQEWLKKRKSANGSRPNAPAIERVI